MMKRAIVAGTIIVLLLGAVSMVACQGPEGQVGKTGASGAVGPKGDVGPAGAVGPKGDTGPAGAAGAAGPAGPAGAAGAVGPAGPAGPAGAVGPAGPAGPAGAAGPAGPKGDPAVPPPAKTVKVNAGADQAADPGASVTIKAAVAAEDGSSVAGYKWVQTAGVPATLSGASSDTVTVKLGDAAAYKAALLDTLRIDDRFGVQGINPHSLEVAEVASFKVTVTTSSGSYGDTVNVSAHLPFAITTGLTNVPTKVAVLLNGKKQETYSWSVAAPSGSAAKLTDAAGKNPVLTPDVAGKYTLKEATSGASFDLYAGTWTGVITGFDADRNPTVDNMCTMCHNGTIAPDKFTPWRGSGHAEIMTQNVENPAGHWTISCAGCHTVGYDTEADNGGFDEAAAKDGWKAPAHGEVGYMDHMVKDAPGAARLTNIQCENCHGPQNSAAHTNGAVRTSLSAEVCGSCHGEPARHGRYQQWEESRHADTTLAIERGTNTSCARCHAGEGFLAWLPQLEAGNSGSLPAAAITWTADTVHSQTCAVCHDTHALGTFTSEPNDAILRVQGDTPMLPSGFQATGVGKGALCMTCHNTRNGAHGDASQPTMDDRAPHTAAQADVLMGENAYFVTVGQRSKHALIADTCTRCHMVISPPPAEFSYNLGGTNHSFEASAKICGDCHGAFDADGVKAAVSAEIESLKHAIEQAIAAEIAAQTAAGNSIVVNGADANEAAITATITAASTVSHIELTESHGRAAMNIDVDGTHVSHVRLASDTKVGDGTLVSSEAGQRIAKACWNFFLVEGDGSEGIHNPSFVLNVLKASVDALK